jgi:hypothetical protein
VRLALARKHAATLLLGSSFVESCFAVRNGKRGKLEMDLEFSAEERQFRESVRAFLRSHLAPDLSAKVLGLRHLEREDVIGWQRTLHSVGWGGPSWP